MCARSIAEPLGSLLLVLQLGAGGSSLDTLHGSRTPGGPALDQLERSVTRPVPSLPPPALPASDRVWVPDRFLGAPEGGTVHVPGHWEQRLSDREFYVPPLTVCNTVTGACSTLPAGVQPPVETRPVPSTRPVP